MREGAVFLSLFVAGVGGGYVIFSGPRGTGPLGFAQRRVDAALESGGSSTSGTPESTDAKAQRLVVAARRKGGQAIERNNELYLAIEALSAEDFRRLLTDIGALKAIIEGLGELDEQTARGLSSSLIGRWLKVDPEGALKWLPRVFDLVPKDSRALVLDAVAAKRPVELLGLVASEKDPSTRAEIISRGLAELAGKDLAKAQAWLNACSDPADRKVAEKAMRKGIAKADPLRAIEIAGNITDPQERREIISFAATQAARIGPGMLRQLATQPLKGWMLPAVLGEFAEHDPVMAVDLALKSDSEGWEKNSALRTAFGALGKRDHELAIAKLEGLKGAERASAIAQIGYQWAIEEPAAALKWLAERPASERNDAGSSRFGTQDALLIAFSDWAESAPDAARAWADALPPGETRDAAQMQRARMLASKGDVAEATQLLSQLGSAADPKTLSTIATSWAQRDPTAAAEWAINQPTGVAQDRAIASVVGAWANDDPKSAGAWLEQFPPGEARDRSIVAFLGQSNSWMAPRESQIAQFDQWFERIDDPWQRAQAALGSYYGRRGRDPAGAREWLLSLQRVDAGVIQLALQGERR